MANTRPAIAFAALLLAGCESRVPDVYSNSADAPASEATVGEYLAVSNGLRRNPERGHLVRKLMADGRITRTEMREWHDADLRDVREAEAAVREMLKDELRGRTNG